MKDIVKALEEFTQRLEAGKPIRTTVMKKENTPDGPLHASEEGQLWTVPMVKDKLPDVQVRYNGKIKTARVVGRKLPFAVVSLDLGHPTHWLNREVAWETIVHCLNTNTPILLD